MESKSMRRARRSARALVDGDRILKFILSPKTRRKLVAAAEAGSPPVSAISKELIALVGPSAAKALPVKQFAGICIRAVLEQEGYEVADKGVHIGKDPVFRTGSTYQRAAAERAGNNPFFPRLVRSLSDSEADELLELLLARKGRG